MPAILRDETTRIEVKLLSVRMREAALRRLKTLAAQRGISVQDAVQQAVESWTLSVQSEAPESLDNLQGSLAGVDVHALRREEREAELAKDSHRW